MEDTKRGLEEVGVFTDEYCHIRWEEEAPRLSVHNNLLFVLLNILIIAGQIVSEVSLCTSVCANSLLLWHTHKTPILLRASCCFIASKQQQH